MTRQRLLELAKPILFNTEMVQAILDGRKTVTRRVINPSYKEDEYGFNVITNSHTGEFVRVEKADEDGGGFFDGKGERIVNPPYKTGNILYVRETWCEYPKHQYHYKVDSWLGHDADFHQLSDIKWHPSIHMPKEAARIFLRVTDVRVEKLQDITVDGVEQEGIPLTFPLVKMINSEHLKKFITLWNSTIKKQDFDRYGWNANPWVWVFSFERIKV